MKIKIFKLPAPGYFGSNWALKFSNGQTVYFYNFTDILDFIKAGCKV